MSPNYFSTVGHLRSFLERYDDAAPILMQVVGEESGAWNMFLSAAHGDDCGFKWTPHNPVVLCARHPDVKALPMEFPA